MAYFPNTVIETLWSRTALSCLVSRIFCIDEYLGRLYLPLLVCITLADSRSFSLVDKTNQPCFFLWMIVEWLHHDAIFNGIWYWVQQCQIPFWNQNKCPFIFNIQGRNDDGEMTVCVATKCSKKTPFLSGVLHPFSELSQYVGIY